MQSLTSDLEKQAPGVYCHALYTVSGLLSEWFCCLKACGRAQLRFKPKALCSARTGHSTKSSHGGADAHSTGEVVHHTRRILHLRTRGTGFGQSGPSGWSHASAARSIAELALVWFLMHIPTTMLEACHTPSLHLDNIELSCSPGLPSLPTLKHGQRIVHTSPSFACHSWNLSPKSIQILHASQKPSTWHQQLQPRTEALSLKARSPALVCPTPYCILYAMNPMLILLPKC